MSNERDEDKSQKINWVKFAIECGEESVEFDEARKLAALVAMLEDRNLDGAKTAIEVDGVLFGQVQAFKVGTGKISKKVEEETKADRKNAGLIAQAKIKAKKGDDISGIRKEIEKLRTIGEVGLLTAVGFMTGGPVGAAIWGGIGVLFELMGSGEVTKALKRLEKRQKKESKGR